jgi:hypothetical protein
MAQGNYAEAVTKYSKAEKYLTSEAVSEAEVRLSMT